MWEKIGKRQEWWKEVGWNVEIWGSHKLRNVPHSVCVSGGKLVTKTVKNSESQQSGQCIERAIKRKTERHTLDPLKKKKKS